MVNWALKNNLHLPQKDTLFELLCTLQILMCWGSSTLMKADVYRPKRIQLTRIRRERKNKTVLLPEKIIDGIIMNGLICVCAPMHTATLNIKGNKSDNKLVALNFVFLQVTAQDSSFLTVSYS